MSEQAIRDGEARMKKAVDSTQADLAAQRTGRANPAVLDNELYALRANGLMLSM